MRLSMRVSGVAGLWFLILSVLAVAHRGVVHERERISMRLPIVVMLASDTASPEDILTFESAIAQSGGAAEYISKDAGLAMMKDRFELADPGGDTMVFEEIPGNPLPNAFIVRTTDIGLYEGLAGVASSIAPGSRMIFDRDTARRVSIAGDAVNVVLLCVLGVLSALASVSIRDRMSAAGGAPAVVRGARGLAQLAGRGIREAAISALAGVAVSGGAVSFAGFIASRRPGSPADAWLTAMAGWIRSIGIDGQFVLVLLLGWSGVVLAACVLRATFHPSTTHRENESCEKMASSVSPSPGA